MAVQLRQNNQTGKIYVAAAAAGGLVRLRMGTATHCLISTVRVLL